MKKLVIVAILFIAVLFGHIGLSSFSTKNTSEDMIALDFDDAGYPEIVRRTPVDFDDAGYPEIVRRGTDI